MTKAGILTFHNADSYGAVLQAYALQHVLEGLGAEAEFVQIETAHAQDAEDVSAEEAKSPAAAMFARRMKAEGAKREALFQQFRDEHMNLSRTYRQTDDIDSGYDLFVAGSDQIWNFRIPGADARYFLPFARPEKRFSYAASFGADAIPEKAQEWVAGQLAKFAGLSVREESGCDIIRDLAGREAAVHLDPTLLPDRGHWEEMADSAADAMGDGLPEGPYVFLFMLSYDEALADAARAYADERGLGLKVVTAGFMPKEGIAAWNTTGVAEWLALVRSADAVFTNSFHGLVFSLIFGRDIRIALLGGQLGSRNGRLSQMLGTYGIEEALEGVASPDYDEVWAKMDSLKGASIAYLEGLVSR